MEKPCIFCNTITLLYTCYLPNFGIQNDQVKFKVPEPSHMPLKSKSTLQLPRNTKGFTLRKAHPLLTKLSLSFSTSKKKLHPSIDLRNQERQQNKTGEIQKGKINFTISCLSLRKNSCQSTENGEFKGCNIYTIQPVGRCFVARINILVQRLMVNQTLREICLRFLVTSEMDIAQKEINKWKYQSLFQSPSPLHWQPRLKNVRILTFKPER
jgi:hypothetical protein